MSWKFTRWVERCWCRSRKRQRIATSSGLLEQLESRQLLTAAGSDAVLFGPAYPGDWASVVTTHDDGLGGVRHDEHDESSPHFLPLPNGWTGDRNLPDPADGETLHPLTAIPVLNSLPTSAVNLYLDFNGHFQAEWGNAQNITTPPFTLDNDTSTLTDEELDAIREIFAFVAEDYAPFNVNVTTVEPAVIGDGNGMRVAIGGRFEDWYGNPAGGVAFIDNFTNNQPNVVYVFSASLSGPQTIAEATSHELGHSLGLLHQSLYDEDGKKTQEYYAGDETGAPIMGLSYTAYRTRWWSGTSSSATTIQNDLSVLSRAENGFGYRADDYGNTYEAAATLNFVDNRATVLGLVEQMDDVDVFRFDVAQSNQYRIDYHTLDIGANLDVQLEIRAADGTLIDEGATFQDNDLALGRTFGPGSYQVLIRSDGTYGSLGHYTLQVTLGNDPTLPPTTPGDLTGTYLSPTVAEFHWVDALGETHYVLYATRQVNRKLQSFSVTLPADISTYTLTDHGVLDSWEYELKAVNLVGTEVSEKITPLEIPVTAPQNVLAVRFSSSSLAILWDSVPGAWAYVVQIATAADPGTPLQPDTFVDGTRTETVLTGLQTGIDYVITVTARNSLGDVSQLPITVQIPGLPNPEPLLPPNPVTGTSPAPFSVQLNWAAVSGATLFQIQQRRGKEWITIKVVSAATLETNFLPDGDQPKAQFRVIASNGTSTATSKAIKVRRPPPAWRRR